MMNTHSVTRGGNYRDISRFELERLFGLALTDARFFRQLRDHPYQAVARFELTEPEAQAVLRIAPAARSTQELALEFDAWMTDNGGEAIKAVPREHKWGIQPALRRPVLPAPVGRERHAQHTVHASYVQVMPLEPPDDEQRICLPLSECLSQN